MPVSLLRASDLAPSNFQGIGAEIAVSSGSGFLASRGNAVFYSSLEGNQFSLLGDGVNIAPGYGSYTWTKTSSTTGNLTLDDQVSGIAVTYQLTFTSADGGTFTVNEPGIGTQQGNFDFYYIIRPSDASTVLGVGQPILRVENGNAVIEIQIQQSDSLGSGSWQNQSGTVSTDGNGKVIFTAPLDGNTDFYRLLLAE